MLSMLNASDCGGGPVEGTVVGPVEGVGDGRGLEKSRALSCAFSFRIFLWR